MFKRGVEVKRVVILTGKTDMRRGIDGLVSIVRLKYNLDPLDKEASSFSAAQNGTVSNAFF